MWPKIIRINLKHLIFLDFLILKYLFRFLYINNFTMIIWTYKVPFSKSPLKMINLSELWKESQFFYVYSCIRHFCAKAVHLRGTKNWDKPTAEFNFLSSWYLYLLPVWYNDLVKNRIMCWNAPSEEIQKCEIHD